MESWHFIDGKHHLKNKEKGEENAEISKKCNPCSGV